MTHYVVLHPPGSTVEVHEAMIDAPQIVERAHLEVWLEREALRRRLAELDRQVGVQPLAVAAQAFELDDDAAYPPAPQQFRAAQPHVPVKRTTGADGVERLESDFTAQVPGPQFSCFCPQAFHTQADFARHARVCPQYRRVAKNPQAITGAFVWGNVVPSGD